MKSYIQEFLYYLKIERGLSENTLSSYKQDVTKLINYFNDNNISLLKSTYKDLEKFVDFIAEIGTNTRTQARIISGVKSFYSFLELEEYIENDISKLLETPKITKKLPDVLSLEEIDEIVSAIDLSEKEGDRNKAIIEILYGCGVRVSELVNIRLSDLFFEEEFIKVLGKGNKERFIPISQYTQKIINIYIKHSRSTLKIKKEFEDILFLNRRGAKLTRMMIFTIIKRLVQKVGIKKNISPHTFRHSFATHLLDGGADISSIQMMLGHENITTTEMYVHISQKKLRDEIIKFHPRKDF